jgi:hypothetical protein
MNRDRATVRPCGRRSVQGSAPGGLAFALSHCRAAALLLFLWFAPAALAQFQADPANAYAWGENCGWLNFAGGGVATIQVRSTYLSGWIWGENIGWIHVGDAPINGVSYANTDDTNFGVNVAQSGQLSGFAWGENCGWVNFSGGALASPPDPARLDLQAARFRGYAWGENIGWINLDDSVAYVGVIRACGSSDFDCDGAPGTDADIEAFFACLAGACPPPPCTSTADFNGDGGLGTDADIESFFRVLAGGPC